MTSDTIAEAKEPFHIGPPPAGPIVCFPCLTGRCGHSQDVIASSVHGGGYIPAVTYSGGSALCQDCAMLEAEHLPEPWKPDGQRKRGGQ